MKKTDAYKYAVTVDGKVWVAGNNEAAIKAASEAAARGWARGRKIRLVKTKGKEAEEE